MQGFMVTQGEYSDYSVCGVFLKREDAEQYITDRVNGSRYSYFNDIEEIEIHEEPVTTVTLYVAHWQWNIPVNFWDFTADAGQYPDFNVFHYNDSLDGIRVEGCDRERVLKVVTDHRAKVMAERQGIS